MLRRKPMKLLSTLAAIALGAAVSGCVGGPAGMAGPSWLPSPFPHDPAYDVWVNGQYVGSDPDPRIRARLREEAKRSHNLR
jgi:hypothetical protein